jgi:GT2 family glycosyltransferase
MKIESSDRIAIIVVPRDRFSIFPRCLEALYAHTEVRFRLVVMAGAADTTTEAYLLSFQTQHANMSVVLMDRPLMQGEARNIALRQVQEKFCVILENDTIVHKDWLVPMLDCMREENAAVVTPLILWYRGIHTAGCMIEEREKDGAVILRHSITYTDIRRRQIDYPESHCMLIDRQQFPRGIDIFDDVEPFDVDFGLTLQKHGLRVLLEPRSVATYSPAPPLKVRDIPTYRLRWDPATWQSRNRQFMLKWAVTYDSSHKLASYRRQQLKLGLAYWHPSELTVGLANVCFYATNRLLSLVGPTVDERYARE